jgi:hypothetical protein
VEEKETKKYVTVQVRHPSLQILHRNCIEVEEKDHKKEQNNSEPEEC